MQDGLYLGTISDKVQPAHITQLLKTTSSAFAGNTALVTKQGAYRCESWYPNSNRTIVSKDLLVTLDEWDSFVISACIDNQKNVDLNEVIRILELIFRNDFPYLLSDGKELISIEVNNTSSINSNSFSALKSDYEYFNDSIISTSSVDSESNSVKAMYEITYNLHLYKRSRDKIELVEMISNLNNFITSAFSLKSFVTHVSLCNSNIYAGSFGNIYEWPPIFAGSGLPKSGRCLDSDRLPIPRMCRWNFKKGAFYEPFHHEICSRFSICPQGFRNIFTKYCASATRKNTWINGFRESFWTGKETSLLRLMDKVTETNKLYDFIKYIIHEQNSTGNVTWLPIRRIRKHGPLIDVSFSNIPIPLDWKYTNPNLSWISGHPHFSKDCVALDLNVGRLFSANCDTNFPFISVVNMSSILNDDDTVIERKLFRNGSKCEDFGGFDSEINLKERLCIIKKSEQYSGWEGAKTVCEKYDAKLPQPGRMFMNWEYKNLLKHFNLTSMYIQMNDSLDYTDWQINTQFTNIYGVMDHNGWKLTNDTNAYDTNVTFCERELPNYASQSLLLYQGKKEGEINIDYSNIEDSYPSTLQCYINGRPIEHDFDFTSNNKAVITALHNLGYIQCQIWRKNTLEYILSNTLLRAAPGKTFTFVVKVKNLSDHYRPSIHDNTYFMENHTNFFQKENLDLCQTYIYRKFELFSNETGIVFSSMEHNYFVPIAYQYMTLNFEVASTLNVTEESLLVTLQNYLTIDQYNTSSKCSIIEVRSTVGCRESVITEPLSRRQLTWNSTSRSGNFVPIEICIDSDGFPLSRKCLGDFVDGYYWDWNLTGDCLGIPSDITKDLTRISKSSTNISQLLQLTEKPELLKPVDVTLITKIFDNVIDHAGKEVANDSLSYENIFDIMNNLLHLPKETYDSLHHRLNTTNDLLFAFETLIFNSEKETQAERDRLYISGERILVSEIGKYIGYSSFEKNGKNETKLISREYANSNENITAEIILPENISEFLSFSPDNINKKVSFVIYNDDKLFVEPIAIGRSRGLNSKIVQASVENFDVKYLSSPVELRFRPLSVIEQNTFCVYWDYSRYETQGGWSSDGCWKGATIENITSCFCDHLTSFALLMNFDNTEMSSIHAVILNQISIIGCLLSMFGLLMVIITYCFFDKWRKTLSNKIIFHLSLSIFFGLVTFIGGITRTEIQSLCRITAILLHYFLLVSFNWMLVEGIHQYRMFVKVIGTYIPRFMWKAAIFAWGLPILPIIALLVIDDNFYDYNYNSNTEVLMCWISPVGFRYALLPHLTIIMTVNLVLFIIIIVSVVYKRPTLNSNMPAEKIRKQEITMSICVFSLLGFTWIFGLLSIFDPSLFFSYLFCIFNTLQGFFIFILHITRDRNIRKKFFNYIRATVSKSNISVASRSTVYLSQSTYNSMSKGSSKNDNERFSCIVNRISKSQIDDLPFPTYNKDVRFLSIRKSCEGDEMVSYTSS